MAHDKSILSKDITSSKVDFTPDCKIMHNILNGYKGFLINCTCNTTLNYITKNKYKKNICNNNKSVIAGKEKMNWEKESGKYGKNRPGKGYI